MDGLDLTTVIWIRVGIDGKVRTEYGNLIMDRSLNESINRGII